MPTGACPCGGRGKIRKTRVAANPFLIIEQEELFVPSKGWAGVRLGRVIRKVYKVDPSVVSLLWGPDVNHLFHRKP
jgi:hypothetical protein